ncbi:uncharacterized protein EDB93DRAFT_1106622 [Suillus bovinus]|uniref:uncharacterized protein n=1 Tax=Suillus bovinus TaxID=48563 RepID=UPI001B874E37|nr:uncharacterized protein EDB93DRAFT_1106622 [Suillus bovinus]KAG2137424.1 hypothetical protein EDB93DRAFT_1106622 [Suillus bovinus]
MQQFNSNADLSAVSDIIGAMDYILDDVSSQTGVGYRHRQLVEDARVVQSSNPHGVFSSAIWRLPTEILTEIFLYCMPEYESRTPSQHLAPVLLTRVCKRWRDIALDMPNLWCRLRLEVGPSNWQQSAFCYNFYLKRSRGLKLSLALDCHNNGWMELQSLLQCVMSFSGADSLAIADFHGLSELVIYTGGTVPLKPFMRSIVQLPPSMRSLKLVDMWCHLEVLPGVESLGWASLTNLEIVVNGLDCFVHLLQLCPNLSSLTMNAIFTTIETTKAFVHPRLQYLGISGHSFLNSTLVDLGLFNAVTLPNLRGIEVRHMCQWPHEEFKAFLTRSQCPLEILIFGDGVMVTNQQLAEYVELFPSLHLVTDTTRSGYLYT